MPKGPAPSAEGPRPGSAKGGVLLADGHGIERHGAGVDVGAAREYSPSAEGPGIVGPVAAWVAGGTAYTCRWACRLPLGGERGIVATGVLDAQRGGGEGRRIVGPLEA